MNFKIIPSDQFKREAKRLIKKFPSLKQELIELNLSLERTPDQGTALINNTFKIRLAIKSKGKGKIGGARVITYLINNNIVYLLIIYDKLEFDSIDDKTIRTIVKSITDGQYQMHTIATVAVLVYHTSFTALIFNFLFLRNKQYRCNLNFTAIKPVPRDRF